VERSRSEQDRRVVVTRITPAGQKMLSAIDEEARSLPQQALGHLGEKKLQSLIDLLEEARKA
jgi:DNA-binding MarR family transcriptional regulator